MVGLVLGSGVYGLNCSEFYESEQRNLSMADDYKGYLPW